MQTTELTHAFVEANGVVLHVVQAGPEDGPLLLLLHGFPEFWYGWRAQIPYFAAAGFRVWAPDQRGYNLSAKPRGLDAYGLDNLAADAVGLIDAAGRAQAYLVGHDWGAMVAWWTAVSYPQRLIKMGILNVPHPAVMNHFLRASVSQRRKSWYALFFQLPWIPEIAIRAGNWQAGVASLKGSSRRGTFSAEDLARYRLAWSRPGAFTAMLNWYRALWQRRPADQRDLHVRVPTMIVWGVRDAFLDIEMVEPSIAMCENGRYVLIPEATHWVQHEEAPQVNQLLGQFFAE